ncbi:MAG: hypothetical protein ACYDBX_04565 [Patescibacteria group bacterium]
MKELQINITKAKIKSFHVDLRDDLPEVSASIALLTENGQEITTYQISTQSYYGKETKFDVPAKMIQPILKIAESLEEIVTEHCKNQQKLLANEVKV